MTEYTRYDSTEQIDDLETFVDRLVDRLEGTWSDDDPTVLAIATEKEPVVADVDGDLLTIHDGLVGPIETSRDELRAFLEEAGDVVVRLETLSDHEHRFDPDIFEWRVDRTTSIDESDDVDEATVEVPLEEVDTDDE
ncbi:MAG: hypothetical protein SV760_00010 [Halobacteria archaeon]|nr:hypothetical protein [Halobacteria archaeon]